MTGEEFVKLCHSKKESILEEYFNEKSETQVGSKIKKLINEGVDEKELFSLLDNVMTDSFYTMLLGIDGAASIGGASRLHISFLTKIITFLTNVANLKKVPIHYSMTNAFKIKGMLKNSSCSKSLK